MSGLKLNSEISNSSSVEKIKAKAYYDKVKNFQELKDPRCPSSANTAGDTVADSGFK